MAEAAEAPEALDDLELPADGLEADAPEKDELPEGQDGEIAPEPEDDEIEIGFGDEAEPAERGENSDLVRHLRAKLNEANQKLAARPAPEAPKPIDPGPKPTLEGCDYDGDKFEQELDAWKDRKGQADKVATQAQQAQQAEAERFQQRLQVYGDGKTSLKVKDFDTAETVVTSTLSPLQQAVALKAASDPAKLVYALGRHPAKLAEVAKLSDPIEFAVAIAKLEGQLKVTQRKPPEPDTPLRGAGQFTAKADPAEEKLEREAARTGDRTAIVKYRREKREREAAKGRK